LPERLISHADFHCQALGAILPRSPPLPSPSYPPPPVVVSNFPGAGILLSVAVGGGAGRCHRSPPGGEIRADELGTSVVCSIWEWKVTILCHIGEFRLEQYSQTTLSERCLIHRDELCRMWFLPPFSPPIIHCVVRPLRTPCLWSRCSIPTM
jgi:hypothetical protein